MISTTFPSTGQQLTSSALTQQVMQAIFQALTCNVMGFMAAQPFAGAVVVNDSNEITMSSVVGIKVGFHITDVLNVYGGGQYGDGGYGGPSVIPDGTVVEQILGNVLVISNRATGNATEVVYLTDPQTNTLVRNVWQQEGAPAWGIEDNVAFVKCTAEPSHPYNLVRDEGITQNEDGSVTQVREYTRVWRVHWSAYGPYCFGNLSLLRSALQLDVTIIPLTGYALYVMPDIQDPLFDRELFDGRWWPRSLMDALFYEQVTETITSNTVRSVELVVETKDGVALDFTVTQS